VTPVSTVWNVSVYFHLAAHINFHLCMKVPKGYAQSLHRLNIKHNELMQ